MWTPMFDWHWHRRDHHAVSWAAFATHTIQLEVDVDGTHIVSLAVHLHLVLFVRQVIRNDNFLVTWTGLVREALRITVMITLNVLLCDD